MELPKKSGLLLDPATPPDCGKWPRYKVNEFVVNNTHSHCAKMFNANIDKAVKLASGKY